MAERQSCNIEELFISLPKYVLDSLKFDDFGPNSDEQKSFRNEEFNLTEPEKRLVESILRDDCAELIDYLKRFTQKVLVRENIEGGRGSDPTEVLDRGTVSKLLHLCCAFDARRCASALIRGEAGSVPLINEMDDTGWSALHKAADMHAKKCIELLLKKRARTDIRSKDKHAQLPVELALSSRRMDVVWNSNDSVEDLLVCLSEKDLTAVKLLAEKTKEIAEVAYVCATECRVVSLAALLIVAAERVKDSVLVLPDADLGTKEKTSVYECVIREALFLGQNGNLSPIVNKETSIWSGSKNAERRKLLLCEMELLHLFGAVAQRSGFTEKRIASPLIRASQAGDEEIILILLKTKTDVNDADAEGNSALHWSLKTYKHQCAQHIRIICYLLMHGAQVHQKNLLGLTAIHIAAGNGNKQALQILLSEDPDSVDCTTEMQETPLFFASKNDFLGCAQILLSFGANTDVLNLRRQRPIDLAKSQDMRYALSSTNMKFARWAFQRKYTASLQDGQLTPEVCEEILPMNIEGSTTASPITEHSSSCGSLGGSLTGAKCHYAHSNEDPWQAKEEAPTIHSLAADELARKIFVGGLPPSLDSGSLGKFFEERFGSVEDAIVISNQAGNQIQSRGFGFITFKDKQSVSAAIGRHHVTIDSKQVEIKNAVPKCMLLAGIQKLSPKKQQKHSPVQPQTLIPNEKKTGKCKPEQKSLVDGISCVQQKTHLAESEPHFSIISDENMPTWVGIFKEWLPSFLQEISKHLKEGEWYPLSSLKADFRTTCGIDLDHVSLGYPKLSDFMRSMPSICHMKVVPVGGHGSATHMVLLPRVVKPNELPVQSITAKGGDKPTNDNPIGLNLHKNLPFLSSTNGGFRLGSLEQKSSHYKGFTHEGSEANQTHQGSLHCVHPQFLEFLKPDPIFHGRPWLMNSNNGGTTGSVDGERNGEGEHGDEEKGKGKKLWQQQEGHVVLESLARVRGNTSVYFLRDYHFVKDYPVCLEKRKCIACKQGKMLWANLPCNHLLWCGDCKLKAEKEVNMVKGLYKCVVCDVEVVSTVVKPWKQTPQRPSNVPSAEFPPFETSPSLGKKNNSPQTKNWLDGCS